MSKDAIKNLERDLEIFCEEFGIEVNTFLNWIKYPGLLKRIENGNRIKPVTIERIYSEMDLRRFKIEVKDCDNMRQAVQVAQSFLRRRDIDIN